MMVHFSDYLSNHCSSLSYVMHRACICVDIDEDGEVVQQAGDPKVAFLI
jgi:hypothetical protein